MELYIAEKPSLAKVIAHNLGGGKSAEGHIRGPGCCIAWCFGHMYELAEPEDYNPDFKKWSFDFLPIIPGTWRRKPRRAL